jgi:hypothetical protein
MAWTTIIVVNVGLAGCTIYSYNAAGKLAGQSALALKLLRFKLLSYPHKHSSSVGSTGIKFKQGCRFKQNSDMSAKVYILDTDKDQDGGLRTPH